MEHSFNIEVAQEYGVNAAIVLRHLQFWIIKNKTHNKNFHDGRYWTYYSVSAFTKIFPYLTKKQVRRALQVLIDHNVILKGDYNKFKNTKTCWYAFVEESSFAPEGRPDKKPFAPEGRPVAPEGKPFAPEGRPVAPEGKPLSDKDKTDKPTDELTDNTEISQKADLSSKEKQHHYACTLLFRYGVDLEVARAIVYDQHTPLASIKDTIKNGLAKEKESGGKFVLEPGYIVKTLNTARSEGKIVGPTKSSKQLIAGIAASKTIHTPLEPKEFEKRKRRGIAALGISKQPFFERRPE
jgi:hypothetical protein